MAEDDGLDIDPAIAEAMGFSGFGMQPSSKKRKFDANDTFVDPSVKQDAAPANAQSKGKNANNVPLGIRTVQGTPAGAGNLPLSSAAGGGAMATHHATGNTAPQTSTSASASGGSTAPPDLQALRHGVENARGDMVYFLPSFIQNPWKDLQPR
ncbi:hypothetical protein LTR65_007188 [Meristemomyces frigidus]